MDEVYVDITKTNKWISKYFNKHYIWYKVDEQIDEERLGINNVGRDE